MCKEIVLYNDDPNNKTDRTSLFNDRGNRLAFIDEQHAIYFIEVEHPEIIDNGYYKNYFIREYLSGDDELGRPWNGYYDKENIKRGGNMAIGMNQQFIQFEPRTQKFRVIGKCRYCEEPQQINIPVEDIKTFVDWWEGEDLNIQDATPNTPAEQRELLISGICPKCWGAMFGGDT